MFRASNRTQAVAPGLLSQPGLEALPTAVYTTDTEGALTSYNSAAARLWGHEPELGSSTWLSSWRLLSSDGSVLPQNLYPEAISIAGGVHRRGVEALVERPDGTRIPYLVLPTPMYDASGCLTGAINVLIDISEQKRNESSLLQRMEEQRALFQLTNKLQHVATLPEAYEAALDAIIAAMGCDRASILLFDDGGVMRFAAWRGLSDGYRAAVEGHSPWERGTSEPRPICIHDIASNNDFSDAVKHTVMGEGIAGLLFVPLMADGKLVGKFMAYYDEAHGCSEDEKDFALTIGRQVGFALEQLQAEEARRKAEDDLRESERHLQFALKAGGMGAWEWNITTGVVFWSTQIEEMHGLPPNSFGGTFDDFQKDILPEDRSLVLSTIKQALENGDDYRVTYRILKPDGEVRWMEASGKVVGMPPTKLAGVCMDVTDRKHDEERIFNLMREVNHRSKNLLALVQAVAKFTAASNQADFLERFSERLRGMAASQDLLVDGGWSGVDFAALAHSQLAVFGDLLGNRIQMDGPALRLSPSAAQSIGMALHELTTNAGKYGALSTVKGTVQLDWRVTRPEETAVAPEPLLEVSWVERGGPTVAPPKRKGFGHTVICSLAKWGASGAVEYLFEPEGVTWRLSCPAASALEYVPDFLDMLGMPSRPRFIR